ncbi:MAG: hypothetical protein ACXWVG_18970 [Telluria sp.]
MNGVVLTGPEPGGARLDLRQLNAQREDSEFRWPGCRSTAAT